MRLFKSQSKKQEATQFYIEPTENLTAENKLAVAVLVKNEAASIVEWLKFHHAAGVDVFIIYDDGCTDDTVFLAKQAVPPDALIVIPWCQRIQDAAIGRAIHNQGLAFAHAVANFRQSFRWMAFIDIDEFLFPTKAVSIKDALPDVDNILLPWQMFGRQGYATTPPQVLPNYTKRYRAPYQAKVKGILNFKCIVNPSKVTKTYVHGFETNGNKQIWNSVGQPHTFGDHQSPEFDQEPALQLNHYYIKSASELETKAAKGSIGDSIFTSAFKTQSDRRKTLERRLLEIERDTVIDIAIQEYCARINFDANS